MRIVALRIMASSFGEVMLIALLQRISEIQQLRTSTHHGGFFCLHSETFGSRRTGGEVLDSDPFRM